MTNYGLGFMFEDAGRTNRVDEDGSLALVIKTITLLVRGSSPA
jgi:hypothetical protein